MTRLGTWVLMAMVGGFTGIACSASDELGTGDDALTKDSFDEPTEHGALRFGETPNEAKLTDSERFHAWTFTLSKGAKLDLRSEIVTANLDSVIYLYRRDPGATSWGEYVATNDDETGTTLASRIDGSFAAGEYLVKLKAKKTPMTGTLRIRATCTGGGCPKTDATCAAGTFVSTPKATGFGASCKGKIEAVFGAAVTSKADATTSLADKCDLDPLERSAIDFYHGYWDDLGGWENFTGGEGNGAAINVRRETHGTAGTIVNVDIGGDEDAMTYVYDGTGKLLMYFQHNQSPDWAFFCRGSNEKSAEDPAEACFSELFETGHLCK